MLESVRDKAIEDMTWNKYCQVYFRDSARRSFEKFAIKESLLKLPRGYNSYAISINRVLLKVVTEEVDARVLLEAVNFVIDTIRALDHVSNQQEGLTMRDETFCQLLRMTQDNPER